MGLMFVCNLNIMGRDGKMMLAGHPFDVTDLVEHTFKSLESQGHISPYILGGANTSKKVVTATVSNLKKGKEEEKEIKQALVAELKKLNIKVSMRNSLQTLREALAAAKSQIKKDTEVVNKVTLEDKIDAEVGDKPENKVKAACIWDANPEDIKNMPIVRLVAIYKQRCAEFNIEPKNITGKQKLIDQLSSEYNK